MPLFLTEADISQLLTMDVALAAVEDAFHQQGRGLATTCPRQRARTEQAMLHVMPGALTENLGLKYYCTSRSGARFWVALFDGASGDLQAFLQADQLGRARTGAASGIATKYLARRDAAVLGLFGTGKQARAQAEAICAVRPIQQIKVCGRNQEKARAFARELTDTLGVAATVASPEATVRGSDIVSTITTATAPVLAGEWLEPGTHVNAAGSNKPTAREIDDTAVQRAGLVTVDHLEQAQGEAGDLILAAAAGAFDWTRAVELAQVVAGRHPGRQSASDITLFASQGIALWDLAAARRVYDLARQRGIGRSIAL